MLLKTDTAELIPIAVVAIFLLAALAYIALGAFSVRRERRNIRAIVLVLTDYFRKSGVAVSVGCVAVPGTRRFTAFIESEPMKRFRLSHIIEMTLREQVHRVCGLELANVYWRFPINKATQETPSTGDSGANATTDQGKTVDDTDDYINEGLVNYRDLPKFEVTELPWETFQEAAATQPGTKEKPD